MKHIVLPTLAALIASSIPQFLPAATEAGISWDRRRFENESMRLNAVAVNDSGRIVAVGVGGAIRYSDTDGSSWTTIDSPTHLDLTSIHWDGTRFVVGSGELFQSGMILTSTDGLDWQRICLGSAQQILCVCGSPTTTLAMGHNGTSLSTSDTSSWSSSPAGVYDHYYGGVWSGTQFVRVGYDALIETSPAGAIWTPRHSSPDDNLDAVASNGSRLVAVGWDNSASLPLVLTSDDGVAWTPRDMSAFPGSGLKAIVWTGSHFVTCGLSTQVLTSPDGETWSTHSIGAGTLVSGLCWTGSSLIAVGDGGFIATTPMAAPSAPAHWTVRQHSQFAWAVNAFAQADAGPGGANRIVAVAGHGGIFYSDDDGVTGTDPTSGTTRNLNDVTEAAGGFIAVGDNGTILTSADGDTWNHPPSGVTTNLYGVTWYQSLSVHTVPNRAIAVGNAGTILTADDGIGWTTRSSSTISSLRSVASGLVVDPKPPHDASRLVVAVGLGGAILTSSSGTVWTTVTPAVTSENLYHVIARPGGGFVAVGGHGLVLRSPDGATWLSSSTGDGEYLYAVTWTGSQYVAVGGDGVIHTSPNAITWTRRYGRTSNSLDAVITSPTGRILAGGNQGVVISSDPAGDFADWIAAQSPPAGEDDPDDDPNGDGITNLVAYGHGIPAVAPSSPADRARLPRLVDPMPGQPTRIRLGVNDSDLGDAVYIIDWSPDLSPGSWTEVLRHTPGQECATGSAHVYSEDTGFVEIEIPEAIGALPSKFYRTRTTLNP